MFRHQRVAPFETLKYVTEGTEQSRAEHHGKGFDVPGMRGLDRAEH